MRTPKPTRALLAALVALGGLATLSNAQSVTTTPVGAVNLSIQAGTGSAKRVSLISAPLFDSVSIQGKSTGRITGISTNSISDTTANWSAGQLSSASAPFLIQITSGQANGQMFLISSSSANTATSVTISADDTARVADLTSLGILVGAETGDTYRIIPCDTLSSLFGTPAESGVLGSTAVQTADSVLITTNGIARTYFYSTTLNRWTQATLGNPDASNVPVRPDFGLQYARLQNQALNLTFIGTVPNGSRKVLVKNSGVTIVSQYWPVDTTVSQLNLQATPGWLATSSGTTADTLLITTSTGSKTYYYDGTNWRQQTLGNPIRDTDPVPAGSSVIVSKRGSASGYAALTQSQPYSL